MNEAKAVHLNEDDLEDLLGDLDQMVASAKPAAPAPAAVAAPVAAPVVEEKPAPTPEPEKPKVDTEIQALAEEQERDLATPVPAAAAEPEPSIDEVKARREALKKKLQEKAEAPAAPAPEPTTAPTPAPAPAATPAPAKPATAPTEPPKQPEAQAAAKSTALNFIPDENLIREVLVTSVRDTNLENAIMEQAGWRDYFGKMQANADHQVAEISRKVEAMRAALYNSYRAKITSDGEKATDVRVNMEVDKDPRYDAALKKLNDAQLIANRWKSACIAMADRRASLELLASKQKGEWAGQMRVYGSRPQ